MLILGVDPGSVRVGYGLISQKKNRYRYLKSGLLKFPSQPKEKRLLALQKSFKKLLQKTKPNLIGLEKIYFVKNQKTALEVAQSRGVIIAAILEKGIPFIELTPPEIKKAVTGDGQADKKGVAKMVGYFLNLQKTPKIDDITDALAIAIAVNNRICKERG